MKHGRKSQFQTDYNLLKLWPKIFIKKSKFLQNLLYQLYSREQHVIQWKRARAEFKSLARKNKKKDWEKFASSLNNNTPINQVWNRVRQLKGIDLKKVNILEVNGAQYKDSKSIANKFGDTLAELSLPQNYDSTFLKLKQREEHKTIHVNHTNKENFNCPFSKEELSRAIQATDNSAPGPDKIPSEMLKHLPPEG